MKTSPIRIACLSGWGSKDTKWVWIKDKFTYSHPLELIFFSPGDPGRIDKFLGRPLLGRVRMGWQVRRAVQRGEIDLIVSHLPYCTSWITLLLLGLQTKPYHLAFAFNFTDLPTSIGRWIMRQTFRRVDRFVIFSEMEKQLYGQYFDIPVQKFERIAWGVNPPVDQPGPRVIQAPYVVSMGGEARDYHTLLKVARAMKDTLFVLIVRPKTLTDHELPPNVNVFINIPWIDAWSLVYYSTLTVIPLRSSATPNGHVTLVGGMYLGKAHVVTDSSGIADYVTHNKSAILVPVGDASAMQAAIEKLQSDAKFARKLGVAAKKFVEVNCSEKATTDFFVRFLDKTFSRSQNW